MTMQTDVDVLIIGAGPSGAMAASMLQREGFKLLVVEKQLFPRFVIGESMLPRAMDLLREADLLEAVEKQNFMVKTGAVFRRGCESCDFNFSSQSGDGWAYTYQVPRAEFDKALADAVASRGVEIRYGHSVTCVKFDEQAAHVTIERPDKSVHTVTARFVLDCSGYGRVLPQLLNLEEPSKQKFRQALFTHITGDHLPGGSEQGKIWICIHRQDAWIWIIPFSNGKSSVGVVAEPQFFQQFPSDPAGQLRAILLSDPNAADRLGQAQFVFPPRRIEGYSCSVRQFFGPRFALVGNTTEFLDPVFSSGVMLAMESAVRAAKVLTRQLRGDNPDWKTEYTDHLMQGVNTFRTYVDAWYDGTLNNIFFAQNKDPAIMEKICSVLAGYVWDKSNPYVAHAPRALSLLSKLASSA
jgi:flavin-dependent dehydrogenase